MSSSTTVSSTSQPLLHADREASTTSLPSRTHRSTWHSYRIKQKVQAFLSSRAQHYTVLALVSLDLLCIFADIIINLYQCDGDGKDTDAVWDDARSVLGIAGLVFSCLFMLELVLSVWAFGWKYFKSWFHSFDAIVIVAGFIVDVLLHGILEQVASLIVILRLWRFFKIIEEFSVGAQEQMDGLLSHIEQLEMENRELVRELKQRRSIVDEEEGAAFQSASGSWK